MLHVFDWSSKTRNDVAIILSSQLVSAMGCYTGTIFNVTSLKSLSVTFNTFAQRAVGMPKNKSVLFLDNSLSK